MKNFILLLVIILFFSADANGQYKVNKTKYNFKAYSYQLGDPYNPSVAGLTSFLIPGLGQMISGEAGRGIAFLGGFVGSALIYSIGISQSANDMAEGGDGNKGLGLMWTGLTGMIAIDVWAIIDAIHVAKVNNLAWRAQTKTGYNLRLTPYLGSFQSDKVPVGLSLKVRF